MISECELALCMFISHLVVSSSVTPWTVAHQALLSTEFPRQNAGVGIKPGSPALLADSLPSKLLDINLPQIWQALIYYLIYSMVNIFIERYSLEKLREN